MLVNKGWDSVCRPDFIREEYATLIYKLLSWIDAGREGKSRECTICCVTTFLFWQT